VIVASLLQEDWAAPLAAAAAVAWVGWLFVLLAAAVATRTSRPDPGPETMDLGPESPALVNYLVHHCEARREAVAATLIDLAARGFLTIEQLGIDRLYVVVKSSRDKPLTPYEEQVLEHVRAIAPADGVVPVAALTTGPEDESKKWWKRFQQSVRDDARHRGLSRPRWSPGWWLLLAATAAVPAVLAAAALVALPDSNSANSDAGGDFLAIMGIAAIGVALMMLIPQSLSADRGTPEGSDVTARWLGVNRFLERNHSLDDRDASAVAMWDRYLAYGAALGVSSRAVASLPMGAESPYRAWSSVTGQWRIVRVRYPRFWPPAYGRKPLETAAVGLLQTVVFVFLLRLMSSLFTDALPDAVNSFSDGVSQARDAGYLPWYLVSTAAAVAFGVGALALGARAVLMLWYGVTDLGARQYIEGTVVRVRPGAQAGKKVGTYVAIDDGSTDVVRAIEVYNQSVPHAGAKVRVQVTRRLRFVTAIEHLGQSSSRVMTTSPTSPWPAPTVPAPARPAPTLPAPTTPPEGLGPLSPW